MSLAQQGVVSELFQGPVKSPEPPLCPSTGEKVCGLRVLSSPPPGSTDVGVKKGGRPQVTNPSDKNMGRDGLLDNGDNEGSCSLDDSVLRRNHPQAVMDLTSPFHSENQRSARTDSSGGGRTDSSGGGRTDSSGGRRTDSSGGGRTDSSGGGRTDSRGGGSIPDWLRTSTEKTFEDSECSQIAQDVPT